MGNGGRLMGNKRYKMIITILLVPLVIIVCQYAGGLIGALTAMNLVNDCSNCDDFVLNGLRGYESLGFLGDIVGKRVGLIFGIIISLIILFYRLKRKS
jgi:hypothetical protein